MKKTIRKLISLLVTLSLLVSLFPAGALATPGEEKIVPFDDVSVSDWFYEPVEYVYDKGLMTGTADRIFDPNISTTRGMIVSILHRMEGSPEVTSKSFSDVTAGQWYAEAVNWAAGEGIVSGFEDDTFRPNDPITREQMASIMMRYSDFKGYDTSATNDLTQFDDQGDISDYAVDVMKWAVGCGLLSGRSDTILAPRGQTTRAEAATILMRYCEEIAVTTPDEPDDSLTDEPTEFPDTPVQEPDNPGSDDSSENTPSIEPTPEDPDQDIDQPIEVPGFPAIDPDEDSSSDSNIEDGAIQDSDSDGASDEWEVVNGSDPNKYNSTFIRTKQVTEDKITASVTVELKGSQVENLNISPLENTSYFDSSTPGYMGPAFDFDVDGIFDEATISFEFQEDYAANVTPTIYYWNEETKHFEELETTVNGNTASTTVTHFSTYVLLNKQDFDSVWNNEIRPPEDTSNYSGLDVVFVIDSSSSMRSNDPQDLRKTAAQAFVNKLSENDRAAVITFDSSARLNQGFTNENNLLIRAINEVNSNGWSTNLSAGIDLAIKQFSNDDYLRDDAYKYIIFLTDGNGTYSDTYTSTAANNDIIIYAIGLGNGVEESRLKSIADGTGGKYYFATSADYLGGIYDEIANETVDYSTDSNNDGISDYFTRLLCDGTLRLGSGKETPFYGKSYEEIQANNDYDGDGIINGDEISVIYMEGVGAYVIMNSDPTTWNEAATSWQLRQFRPGKHRNF